MLNRILTSLLFLVSSSMLAQVGIGQWRDHLPYEKTISVTQGDQNRIYCATPFGTVYYNYEDQSITRLNQVNGLSDVSISTINYDPQSKYLVIAYTNANIDLYYHDQVINISDIKRKSMVGSKKINRIVFREKLAYLCCDFGIVVLDPVRREIKDTYYIGPNGDALKVNDLTYDDSLFYAATEKGIYMAKVDNPFLSNYAVWSRDNQMIHPEADYNAIAIHKGHIYTNMSNPVFSTDTIYEKAQGQWKQFFGSITGPNYRIKDYGDTLVIVSHYSFTLYWDNFNSMHEAYVYLDGEQRITPLPNDVILDDRGEAWIADNEQGLIESSRPWAFDFIRVSGPPYENAYSMTFRDSRLWVASGAVESNWGNRYLKRGVYKFQNEKWTAYKRNTNTPAFDSIQDVLKIAVNPRNADEIYIGSWGQGLVQMRNGNITEVFNSSNSTLQQAVNYPGFIGVAGLAYDDQDNLWITNSANPNALHRMDASGKWRAYSLAPLVTSDVVGDLVIDQSNQKWIIMPRGHGIIVYNDNNTPDNIFDDQKKRLNMNIGNGNLPSNGIYSLAVDLEGEVWVGTDKGVVVFYSPGLVFSGDNFDAQQIYIEQEGISQYLLESEIVTAISIDGANRKWFGTRNAGVFLMSSDGTKQIHHFTQANSPLLSDNIYSIAIDDQSGEVFFGTEKGIVSYRSDATFGQDFQPDTVQVFPNPVREDYNGTIAINGLYQDAEIRIADAYGNVVYEGKALGGQAVWNGKNYSGERAMSGVYFVFSSNEDGEFTKVAKILFIH